MAKQTVSERKATMLERKTIERVLPRSIGEYNRLCSIFYEPRMSSLREYNLKISANLVLDFIKKIKDRYSKQGKLDLPHDLFLERKVDGALFRVGPEDIKRPYFRDLFYQRKLPNLLILRISDRMSSNEFGRGYYGIGDSKNPFKKLDGMTILAPKIEWKHDVTDDGEGIELW